VAKRLTDSEKWRDPWFKSLSGEAKLFWFFVLDTCDHAGIWKDQTDDFERLSGFSLSKEDIKLLSSRVLRLDDETFFIPKFVLFQYVNFNPEKNNAHKGVMRSLSKYDISYDDIKNSLKESFKSSDSEAPSEGLSRGTGIGIGIGVEVGVGTGLGTGTEKKEIYNDTPDKFDVASIPEL
jgi:hypothetical protein